MTQKTINGVTIRTRVEKGVLDIQAADNWTIILVLNHWAYQPVLMKSIINKILETTWSLQDGYGDAGLTPDGCWDWSGIRDSSKEGMANMARAIRKILSDRGISKVEFSHEVMV